MSSSTDHSTNAQSAPPEEPLKIVYLAHDYTDGVVQNRAHAFVELGQNLLSFAYHRDRFNRDYQPDWPNIELGHVEDRSFKSRLFKTLGALKVILAHRQAWRAADIVYARNLDLALLALCSRFLTRSRAKFVYEVIDVHPMLAGGGMKSRVLRWIERRVLNRCVLLVVSSPGFIRNYFQPRQNYSGQHFLLENKIFPTDDLPSEHKLPFELPDDQPVWTIGWYGTLRCRKSLELLKEVCAAIPGRVRVYMRGYPARIGEQEFHGVIEDQPNMIYEGEYHAPEDLKSIYAPAHFNWCVDFSDEADNSKWLLPTRIYAGGYFGIPALAIEGHETGRAVHERKLGFTLRPPYAENLKKLLLDISPDEYAKLRASIEQQPIDQFIDCEDFKNLVFILHQKAKPAQHESV